MNDFETNSQQLTDFTRSTIEPFSPEIPSKLSSSQLKLRQLVKKTPMSSAQSDSSTQALNQFSKNSTDAALWKTLSPTVSHLADYSQLLGAKQKNHPSPKLESAVSSKFPLKNAVASPSQGQAGIDDLKGKSTFSKGKGKTVGPLGGLNLGESPKAAGNLDAKVQDINGQSSAKHSGFNPQSHINYMFFQPKTSLYQNRKAIKINSYFQEEDSDEKNLSIGDKANSLMLPQGMLKGGANSKNVSQDNQTINNSSSLIYDNKRVLGKGFTNCKFFKSRVNKSTDKADKNDKNERVLKEKVLQQQNVPESVANKNSNESLAVKKHSTRSPAQFEVETPHKPNTTAEKTLLITQYTITQENIKSHETEPIMLTEVHTPVMAPKLSKNYYMPGRKASMPVVKETKQHTRQTSSSKEARFKSASKPSSKHGSPNKEAYSSAKNTKKVLGEFERSNEMTLSGIQDTTAHTKGTITKDLTFEENEKNTVKRKKLMRANSHGGGGQLEKAIEERIKNEKLGKIGTKTKDKKEKVKEKRGQGWFKSVDYENINKDEARKSLDKRVIEDKENKGEDNRVAVLSQLLQRTNRVLNSYKERERNWQVERQELMERLDRLQEKENLA